jgi:asparagine synthetase B (glutamine-hydrolysing)
MGRNVCSFVYQRQSKRLVFARDPLGRRSLLVHWPSRELPYLLLASVSVGTNDGYDLTELSTEHIYVLDLNSLDGGQTTSFDVSLKCLSRFVPSGDTSVHPSFVCCSLVISFLV